MPLTLTRTTPGAYDIATETTAPGTTQAWTGRGFVEAVGAWFVAQGLAVAGDVKITVLAASLKIDPRPGDQITTRGRSYTIVNVQSDAAGATWTVQGR